MDDQDQANEVEDLEHVFSDKSAKPVKIAYEVLKSVTKNFVQEIGSGAFGVVYLGELQNGMVAVKKLLKRMDLSDKQFLDEVACLNMLKHKNIARFLGYCADSHGFMVEIATNKYAIAEVQQRLLCFEYAPNGNLQDHLNEKNPEHQWQTRYQIFKGICLGLQYLHHEDINHLDLKPENVLLGAHMEPKITDFGLSRNFHGKKSTVVTIHIFGTPGYIAPELIEKGQISSKSDIYSLGNILIKLLLGSNEITENWYESLGEDCPLLKRCTEIAKYCVNRDPKKRPSIDDIIDQLSKTETLVQMVPTTIYEPRNDPNSSLYQILQKFKELSIQTSSNHSSNQSLKDVVPQGTKPDSRAVRFNFQSKDQNPSFKDLVRGDASENLVGAEAQIPQESSTQWASGGSPNLVSGLDDANPPYPYLPTVVEEPSSSFSEVAEDDPLPAIEGLQITGEAFPRRELQASGYSINGTTSCNFEWVRHLDDGSVNFIEGASQPTYLVTADDVDSVLAIEVQPLDDRERKGEIVKVYANDQRKITCDPETKELIKKILSIGHVSYEVLLPVRFLDMWEPAVLAIKREGYSIKCHGQRGVIVTEKFQQATAINIPFGRPSEFSIISADGAEFNLKPAENAPSRDAIVLILRLFKMKAVEKSKGRRKGIFFK